MRELTAEELEKARTMPLEELRALALTEVDEPAKEEAKVEEAKEEPTAEAEPETEEEPKRFVVRKEIDNGTGVVEVFEGEGADQGEAYADLVDKMAEGKRNASLKIRELSQRVKIEDTRTAQQKADDEYLVAQRLQKEPTKTVKEIVAEVIAEREEDTRKSNEAQSRFVATHPDFIPDPANGNRLVAWLQSHGYSAITYDGLEKAYQDLKASGLLKLKAEGSEEATEAETKEPLRIAEPKAEAPQPRSPKRGSNLGTRSIAAPNVETLPSEDEAYTMPLDKLRALAAKQLAQANE